MFIVLFGYTYIYYLFTGFISIFPGNIRPNSPLFVEVQDDSNIKYESDTLVFPALYIIV